MNCRNCGKERPLFTGRAWCQDCLDGLHARQREANPPEVKRERRRLEALVLELRNHRKRRPARSVYRYPSQHPGYREGYNPETDG